MPYEEALNKYMDKSSLELLDSKSLLNKGAENAFLAGRLG